MLDEETPGARNDTSESTAHHLHIVRTMQDISAIEAINFEQLATVTDRLMLLRGRLAKKRPSSHRIEVTPEMTMHIRQSALWRRFTTTALFVALFSVTAAIVSLL